MIPASERQVWVFLETLVAGDQILGCLDRSRPLEVVAPSVFLSFVTAVVLDRKDLPVEDNLVLVQIVGCEADVDGVGYVLVVARVSYAFPQALTVPRLGTEDVAVLDAGAAGRGHQHRQGVATITDCLLDCRRPGLLRSYRQVLKELKVKHHSF